MYDYQTTDYEWRVNGESLQTYAYNVTTLGGDRMSVPQLRGKSTTVSYRPGRQWTPRVPDSRTITIGMWVVGALPDGTVPPAGSDYQFRENWHKLQLLFWSPRKQIVLSKMIHVPGEQGLREVRALASYDKGLIPNMTGGTRANFTVDLELADPYFYGDEIEIVFEAGEPRTQRLEILGDDRTTLIEFDISSGTRKYRLTTDQAPNMTMTYDRGIPDGARALIEVDKFKATFDYLSSNPIKTAGNVQRGHTDPFWFYLEPGDCTMSVSEVGQGSPFATGAGDIFVRYTPRFL